MVLNINYANGLIKLRGISFSLANPTYKIPTQPEVIPTYDYPQCGGGGQKEAIHSGFIETEEGKKWRENLPAMKRLKRHYQDEQYFVDFEHPHFEKLCTTYDRLTEKLSLLK